MSPRKGLFGISFTRKGTEFEATNPEFKDPADLSYVLWQNGDDQGNTMTAAEHEMGVSWTEEVGLLRKT